MEYINSDTLIYVLLMSNILFLLISLHKLDNTIVIFNIFKIPQVCIFLLSS